MFAVALAPNIPLRRIVGACLLEPFFIGLKVVFVLSLAASSGREMKSHLLHLCILADGAIALSVTLSGGALFAS